jgi:methionyl-tRNA formyltransferase
MTRQRSVTRILFMGTPEFAVPSLHALVGAGERYGWQVVAVATQPDRRAGRGKKLVESPVKAVAMEFGIPLLQPVGFRRHPDAVESLRNFAPDLYVVAAYGIILPGSVLELPTYGSINVHASILPEYRGASPINAAILDGAKETGVSIMLMDEGMDTGPVLKQARQSIQPHDTAETLSAGLAELGAETLVQTLPAWLAGEVPPIPQSDLPGTPSVCRMIKKEEGRIDWTDSALHIERMTRAFAPWPSAYTSWHAQPLKIWKADVRSGDVQPGLVVATAEGPAVGTGSGLLLLKEVQPAGKRSMDVASFVNGAHGFVGSILGSVEN